MAEGTDKAGTPDATLEGGTPAGAGTPASTPDGGTATESHEQLRAEVERLRAAHEQDVGEKGKLDEERRERARLEQENQQLRMGYGTAPATAANPYAEAAAQMQRDYVALQQSDDPRDRLVVANINYVHQLEAQQRFTAEMSMIPLPEQKAVAERAVRERLTPSLALDRIKAERYDKERADLDARRKRLDEEDEARKRGRVDTSTTPIPGRDLQSGDMTPEEYTRLCNAAEKRDPKARQRLRDFDEERVKMRSPG